MKTKACQFNLRKIRSVLSFVITALVLFASTPAFSQETIIYAEGFENNNGNYIKIIEPADPQFSTFTGDGLWQWGTPSWISAHSGSMCWGTNFAGNMPKSTSSIVSPAISLASYNSSTHTARVSFWAQTDISITGVEAVEVCRNNPDLDLVLMDIRMPKMDGIEATRQIRLFNKDVIIIAQTDFAFSGDNAKAIEAGCNDYISKPINMTLLYEIIEKHINN